MQSLPELLNTAADLLARDGWVQGEYSDGGARCAVGAITAAATQGEYVDPSDIEYSTARQDAWRACQAVAETLGLETSVKSIEDWSRAVVQWNDDPDTQQHEVVSALRETAEHIAEARAARGLPA